MLFQNSSPEKRRRLISWSLLILYVSFIFSFIPYAVPTLKFLVDKAKLDLNLSMFFLGVFILIVSYSYSLMKTTAFRNVKAGLFLSFIVMGYLILFIFFTKTPMARFHLFEYGVLGCFAYQALSVDLKGENIYGAGMIIVILVGTLDEIFQLYFPNRFGDLKDIFINSTSGLLGLGAFATLIKPSGKENLKKQLADEIS